MNAHDIAAAVRGLARKPGAKPEPYRTPKQIARLRALAREAARETGARGQVLRHLREQLVESTAREIDRRIAFGGLNQEQKHGIY